MNGIRYLRELAGSLRAVQGWRDRRRLISLKLERRRGGGVDQLELEHAVPLRLGPLGGRAVWVRPRSPDLDALSVNFGHGHHLPPEEAAGEALATIAVFGSNIGVGMADLAARHPQARILGVEPDPVNMALARRTLDPWSDRTVFVEAAVWPTAGPLGMEWSKKAWGLTVRSEPEGGTTVEARTPQSLLDELAPGGEVDYLLIHVEGSELQLLQQETDWWSRVRMVKIEVEESLDAVTDALRGLGFGVRVQDVGWGAFVVGIRNSG